MSSRRWDVFLRHGIFKVCSHIHTKHCPAVTCRNCWNVIVAVCLLSLCGVWCHLDLGHVALGTLRTVLIWAVICWHTHTHTRYHLAIQYMQLHQFQSANSKSLEAFHHKCRCQTLWISWFSSLNSPWLLEHITTTCLEKMKPLYFCL